MQKVLVLLGGTSSEREVSLRSGDAVAKALQTADYEVTLYDPADGTDKLLELLPSIDVVFPALHGEGGEDGVIQELLETNNIPFVGSGSRPSKLCFDKQAYKQHLIDHSFPVPRGELVNSQTFVDHPLKKQPYVLKPYDGGSSIDTYIVRNPDDADDESMSLSLAKYSRMLLEELVEGTETTVAILGDKALPVIEIIPPQDEEFDYANKYNGKTQELCPPRNVSAELQEKAQHLAHEIHSSTGCTGMSRTDIIISDLGKMYVLETNTIPGLTNQSLLPKAAQAAGIDMPELVDILIKDALTRA